MSAKEAGMVDVSPSAGPVTLINLFEVPPAADDGFMGAWQWSADFMANQDGYLDTALHRSLSDDAEFRFVNVAQWASPDAFQAAVRHPNFPGGQMPFPAHPALYTVVREDEPNRASSDLAVLINPFEVPVAEDDIFLAGWERARDAVRDQPGYVGTRLHRSLRSDTSFRFVNIGFYADPASFQAAIQQPVFRMAAATIPHRPHPALYTVIRST